MAGHNAIIGSGDSETVFESKAGALASGKAILARYRNGEYISERDIQFLRVCPVGCRMGWASVRGPVRLVHRSRSATGLHARRVWIKVEEA